LIAQLEERRAEQNNTAAFLCHGTQEMSICVQHGEVSGPGHPQLEKTRVRAQLPCTPDGCSSGGGEQYLWPISDPFAAHQV